jgi:hypothetical protein
LDAILVPQQLPAETVVVAEDSPAEIDPSVVAGMSDAEIELLLLERLGPG